MDFLTVLTVSFPELDNVIRTGHLPLRLATSPSVLVSWLLVLRTLVDLDTYPHVLCEIFESLGSDLCIARFPSPGPPVVGCPDYVEEISNYEKPCSVLRVPPDFDVCAAALSMHINESQTHLITSPPSVVLENHDGSIEQWLRYLPQKHGDVRIVREVKSESCSPEKEQQYTESSVSGMTLMQYLEDHSRMTNSDNVSNIFSVSAEKSTISDFTNDEVDDDADDENSAKWKWRPDD